MRARLLGAAVDEAMTALAASLRKFLDVDGAQLQALQAAGENGAQSRRGPDPHREWVLRELIHYLSSEAPGATGFEDMGESWVAVRKAARDGTLRPGDAPAHDVAERWEQFINYLALSLAQELGATVTPQRLRRQTAASRLEATVKELASAGEMGSTLRIPDAVGPLEIRTDLRGRQTVTSVTIDAPRAGGLKARFTWLMRQLKDAPDDLRVEAAFPNARSTTTASLGAVRERPEGPLLPAGPEAGAALVGACALPSDGAEARACGGVVRPGDERAGGRVLSGSGAELEALAGTGAETSHRGGQ